MFCPFLKKECISSECALSITDPGESGPVCSFFAIGANLIGFRLTMEDVMVNGLRPAKRDEIANYAKRSFGS